MTNAGITVQWLEHRLLVREAAWQVASGLRHMGAVLKYDQHEQAPTDTKHTPTAQPSPLETAPALRCMARASASGAIRDPYLTVVARAPLCLGVSGPSALTRALSMALGLSYCQGKRTLGPVALCSGVSIGFGAISNESHLAGMRMASLFLREGFDLFVRATGGLWGNGGMRSECVASLSV